MRQVYLALDALEAHIVRGLLEADGINAVVLGDDLFEQPVVDDLWPSVWVVEDTLAEQARNVVMVFSRGEGSTQDSWHCSTCKEQIEPQFTECWQCRTSRPYSL
ncbi:MAG: DUF2007 domain-containing protein [Gammaproteobacteria bacterium]|nr:DUF2007 domain-containing protein [Gammaproteobacteria bacterium]